MDRTEETEINTGAGNMKTSRILLVIIALWLQGCHKDKVFQQFIEIPGNTWNRDNILHFDVSVIDTVHAHDVIILVRNNSNYAYSNLFLFITTTSPMGYSVRDTLNLVLADEKGKWTGKGAADLFTSRHPYRTNIRFPHRGIYSFEIEQALWDTDLKNISDIGLQINRLP
jgi:gliding motility-associated lipoprotein GldH